MSFLKKKGKGNEKTDIYMLKTGRGMEEGEFRMKMEEYLDNTRSIEAILKLSSTY